jgi:hypothetical protein
MRHGSGAGALPRVRFGASRVHLGCISGASRVHLGCDSAHLATGAAPSARIQLGIQLRGERVAAVDATRVAVGKHMVPGPGGLEFDWTQP